MLYPGTQSMITGVYYNSLGCIDLEEDLLWQER
jgi:hypothetical protein